MGGVSMEFTTYTLGEVCSRLSSGKSIKAAEIFPAGKYPVYGGNGLRGYADRSNFEGECAIIGRQGAYCGNVRYFKGEAYMTEHAVVCQANEKANTYYLSALLSTMHLERLSGQSAQPGLAVGTLSVQEINLPSLEAQRSIASILSSLDRKIELNNKINADLEEMAQAIFKNWFVDFEPFKDGKFVDSELGMIPEGWKVVVFDNILKVTTTKTGKEGIPEYSVTNTGIHPRDEKFTKNLSKSSAKNKLIRKGNLVFGMSREILNWGIMKEEVGGVSSAYNVYIVDEKIVSTTYLECFIAQRMDYFADLIKPASREGQGVDKALLMKK